MGLSGLYDLRPLMATYVNEALKLDEEAARTASPLAWPVPAHGRFEAWVGGDESREYHRQSETLAATWSGAGMDCNWQRCRATTTSPWCATWPMRTVR
jgi:arylformamidase